MNPPSKLNKEKIELNKMETKDLFKNLKSENYLII